MKTSHRIQPTVMLFVKAPVPGEVKTRLGATIGINEATDIYRLMAESQLRRIPSKFITEVHYAPQGAGAEMRDWLGEKPRYYPQSSGDLGARLAGAFDQAFARGALQVLAIGADCPTLDADTLHQAAAVLTRCDVAVGPANDGGYYLIGMRRPFPQIFADIPWSSERVLETTIERIRSSVLTWQLLQKMEDIDDEESLRRYIASALGAKNRSHPVLIHV